MTKTGSLAGKCVVITGAGSGIGRAMAKACADDGAAVVLAGRTLEKLRAVADEIERGTGCSTAAVATDVASEGSLERMYKFAIERFGKIDGVVANAGFISLSPPVHALRRKDWQEAIAVNLLGAVMTISLGAEVMVRQGHGGSILATGSSTAIKAGRDRAPYVASKAALHAFVTAAALDLAPHRIRVNTLVPGPSSTPPLEAIKGYLEKISSSLPLGEPVEPEELGRCAAFMLSDAAPHMTGAVLTVDSGRTIA